MLRGAAGSRARRWIGGMGLGLLLALPAVAQAVPDWKGLINLNAGTSPSAQIIRAFVWDPTNPAVAYAGEEGHGIWKSTNGGHAWTPFSSGLSTLNDKTVYALAANISTGSTIYAGTGHGVWISQAGGAWTPAGQGSGTGKLNAAVQSLLVNANGDILAGVFAEGANGGVYKSTNGGQSWTAPTSGNGMPAGETVNGLSVHPATPTTAYAATGDGIYVSTNFGGTWQYSGDGIPGSVSPNYVWVDPIFPNMVFAGTGSNGVYRSVNGGLTWSSMNSPASGSRARGLQVFAGGGQYGGVHVYAGTENGVYATMLPHTTELTTPVWRHVSEDGLGNNDILWSLALRGTTLFAGTGSNGGYELTFTDASMNCSGGGSGCPTVDNTAPKEGQTLTADPNPGGIAWLGIPAFTFIYAWQKCEDKDNPKNGIQADECEDVSATTNGHEKTYILPPNAGGLGYRVCVTGQNDFPGFTAPHVYCSAITDPVSDSSVTPGLINKSVPPLVVTPSAHQNSPEVGDSVYAGDGTLGGSDTWFDPDADANGDKFQWQRCDPYPDCVDIPFATQRTYTLGPADGQKTVRVIITGQKVGSDSKTYKGQVFSADTATILSQPAEATQPPTIAGIPWVGESLSGRSGSWRDPTTVYERRWLRCDANGDTCSYIVRADSPDYEDGPNYTLRPEDVGSTIRLQVTGDVNNDVNHVNAPAPHDEKSAPTAVVTERPPDASGGGGSGGSGGDGSGGAGGGSGDGSSGSGNGNSGDSTVDVIAPVLTGVSLSHTVFRVNLGTTAAAAGAARPRGTTLRATLSEAATLRARVQRLVPGRRVGHRCLPAIRARRGKPKCTIVLPRLTLTRGGLSAGRHTVIFTGRVLNARHKVVRLGAGRYRFAITAQDAAGNKSPRVLRGFRIVSG